MDSKAEKLFQASIALETKRYYESITIMKELISIDSTLNNNEKNLFYVSYKSILTNLKESYNVMVDTRTKEVNQNHSKLISVFMEKLESEASKVCNEAISIIDDKLLAISNTEDKMYYLKVKGDLYRYYCEMLIGEKLAIISAKCNSFYSEAMHIAQALPDDHPVKLGLAFNFSVFINEVQGNNKAAVNIAKTAFNNAIAAIDKCKSEPNQETIYILQVLRDVTLWNSE